MTQRIIHDTAVYNLAQNPTTFDFVTWAVLVKSHGYKTVHFIADQGISEIKYPAKIAWRRFGNILIPACSLAGLDFTVGGLKEGFTTGWHYGHVEHFYRKTGFISKLIPTGILNRKNYVTITIRDSIRNKWRDSNREAWKKFESYLQSQGKDVLVLEDAELAPLDLEYRMALYSQAEMNYGASNGPFTLCHFSEAPYLTINMCPPKPDEEDGYDLVEHMAKGGFPVGSQFSFRNKRQKLFWIEDSFENIVRAHHELWQEIEHPTD